jgi:hypothetical protein
LAVLQKSLILGLVVITRHLCRPGHRAGHVADMTGLATLTNQINLYGREKPNRKMIFQMVGRRLTVTVSKVWGDNKPQTRLVFIAKSGAVNFAAIQKALNGCKVLTEHRPDHPS